MDPYSEAHLFLGAIRVCHHKKGGSPTLDEVCELLDFSIEAGLSIVRKLEKAAIVETSEDPFSIKLSVGDHLAIERLPRQEDKDGLARELEAFKAKKQNMDEKVASIQQQVEKKKKDLFADIEAKFKKEMDKNKGS